MATGLDTYQALRPMRWDGKSLRRGAKFTVDMTDRITARKIQTLANTRWLELIQLGQSAAGKGAR
jgi:hypothetical protein